MNVMVYFYNLRSSPQISEAMKECVVYASGLQHTKYWE
jgi:hypothetical protein